MIIAPRTGRDVGVRNVTDLCTLVDELASPATGEIVVRRAEAPCGSVFVEQGRVCWAAARGLARRLTELLGERASLPSRQMESFFVSCRAQNVPLGEHLVGRGVLAAKDLREALLQHTAESMTSLCEGHARAVWSPRSGKGYSPSFTFTTAELVARVGATAHAREAVVLAPVLADAFGDDDWGAAFLRAPACASPEVVAVQGAIPHASTTLVRLGRWATSSLDVAATFSDRYALLSTTRSSSPAARSIVAFRHGDAVVAGETDEHGPARILNRRAQLRRGGGHGDL